MNVYDLVEAKVTQVGAIISAVLGVVQVCCCCWVLEAVLRSETLAYYSYGLKVGELKLADGIRAHSEAFDLLTSSIGPFLAILKLSVSLGLVSALLQIGSSIFLWQLNHKTEKYGWWFRLWLVSVVTSGVVTLSGFVLPIAYSLTHSIPIKCFLVVTSLNIFIMTHIVTVVLLKFRPQVKGHRRGQGHGIETTRSNTGTSPIISQPIQNSPTSTTSTER